MDTINSVVAANLKRLREQRKMSLDAVAKVSGVSKSMLGQIERGDVNPTISTVWKIAGGMKVPFTDFVNLPHADCETLDIREMEPLLEDDGRYRNYPLVGFDEKRRFEMLYIEMDPGSALAAEAHPKGTREFLTVFSGVLVVKVAGETLRAMPGGAIHFMADQPHRYENTGDAICKISMVLHYSE